MANKKQGFKSYSLWLWGVLCFFYFQPAAFAATKVYVEGINAAPSKAVSTQKDVPLLKLRAYTDTGLASLNSIRFKPDGETGNVAVNGADISMAKLYKDSNNNGIVDSVDVSLATGAWDGTYYNFTSLGRTLDTFGETYLLAYDMASTATTGRTFTAYIDNMFDIGVGSPATQSATDYIGTPLFPEVSSGSSTQTVVNPDASCDIGPVDSKCDAGQTKLTVTDATGLVDGDYLVIGTGPTREVKKVSSVAGNVITLSANLTYAHGGPEDVFKLKPSTIGNKLYVLGTDYESRKNFPAEYKTYVIKPAAGTTEVFVDQLRFCNPSSAPVTVSTIKFAKVGNASDSDILNVKLYDDLNDNLATSGATFLSQGAFSNGFVTLPVGFAVPAGSCNIGVTPNYQTPAFKNLVVKFEIPSTANTDVKAGIAVFDTSYINAGADTVVTFAAFTDPEDEDLNTNEFGANPAPPASCDNTPSDGSVSYESNDIYVLVDSALDSANGILSTASNTTVNFWDGYNCGADNQKSVRWLIDADPDPLKNTCFYFEPTRAELKLQGSNVTCDPQKSWLVTWPNLYIRTDPFKSSADRIEIGSILDVAPPEYAGAYNQFSTTNMEQGRTNVPALGLKLTSQSGQVDVASLNIDMAGGSALYGTDVAYVKVYEDLNQNGAFDSGEPLLATGTSGFLDFDIDPSDGINKDLIVTAGTPRYLLITYDFHINATVSRTYGARLNSISLASRDQVDPPDLPATSSTATLTGNMVTVTPVKLAPEKVKSGTTLVSFLQLQTRVNYGSAVIDKIKVDFSRGTTGADVAKIGIYDDANGDGFATTSELLEEQAGPFGVGNATIDMSDGAPSSIPASKRTITGAAQTASAYNVACDGNPLDSIFACDAGQPNLAVQNASGFLPGDMVQVGGEGGLVVANVAGNIITFSKNLAASHWPGEAVFKSARSRNFLIALDINGVVNNIVRASLEDDTYITLAGQDQVVPICITGDCMDPTGYPIMSTTTMTATTIADYDSLQVVGQPNTPTHFQPSTTNIPDVSTTLSAGALKDQADVFVASPTGFAANDKVTLGTGASIELLTISTIDTLTNKITFSSNLKYDHAFNDLMFKAGTYVYEHNMVVVKMFTSSGDIDFTKLRIKAVSKNFDGTTNSNFSTNVDTSNCDVTKIGTAQCGIKVRLDKNVDSTTVHDGLDCAGGYFPENCNSPTSTADPNREDLNLVLSSAYDPVTGYIQFATTGSDPTLFKVRPDIPGGLKEVWLSVIFPVKSTAVPGNRIAAEIKYSNPDFGGASDIEIDTSGVPPDQIEDFGTIYSGEMVIGGNNIALIGSSLTTGTQQVQQGEKFGLLKLLFSASGSEPTRAVQVSKLQIKRTGTGTDSDIKLVSLYEDTNGNGVFDGADMLMSTTTFDSANPAYATFTNWVRTISVIPGGASQQAILVYTLSNNAASGVTYGADITDQSYVTVVSPDTVTLTSSPISSDLVTTKGNTVVVTGNDLAPAKITPATLLGSTTLSGGVSAGAGSVTLADASSLSGGDYIRIGTGGTQETKQISLVAGNTLTLSSVLGNAHSNGETVVKLKETKVVMEKLSFAMTSTFNYDSSPELLPTAEVTQLRVKLSNSANVSSMTLYRDNGSGTLDSADRALAPFGAFVADEATLPVTLDALLESTIDSSTLNLSTIIISDIFDEGRRFIAGDFVILDPGTANEEKRTISSVTKYIADTNPNKRTVLTLSSAVKKAHTAGSAKIRTYIQPGQTKDFLVLIKPNITASGTTYAEVTNNTYVTVNAPDIVALSPIPLKSSTSTYRDLVTVTPTDLAPANVSLGQTGVPMLKLSVAPNTNSATVNSIKIFESGSSTTDTHVPLVSIYKDANSNGQFDGADTLLATQTFTAQNATLTLVPAQAVDTTAPLVLFAVYDITSSSLATAYTLGARVSDETNMVLASPDEVASTNFPLSSGTPGVLNNDTLTVLTTDPDTESVAPQYAKPSDTNVPLEKISLSASSATVSVSQLKVNKLGTIALSDVSAVKLYADNSSTVLPSIPGSFDSTDTMLLSTTFDGTGVATFATSVSVSYSQYKVLFVGADIAATAPANDTATVGVKVNNGDVSVVLPDKINTFGSFQSALTTISNKDALTVSKSVAVTAPSQISRGSAADMLKLTLTAGSGSVTVNQVKVFENGSANGDTDVSLVSLYEDINGDNMSTSGELFATGTFASQLITFNLSPGLVVTAGTPRSLIVNFTVSATASATKTVQAQLVNSTYVSAASPDVVNFSVSPISSASSTIIGNKLTVSGVDLVPVNCTPNIQQEASCVMEQLSLSANAGTISVSSLKINESGTSTTDSHVERVELILDANGNTSYDVGDSVLSTATFSSQIATFSGLTLPVVSGSPKKLLVIYYISSSATIGQTVAVTMTNNTYVTVVSPDQVDTAGFPVNSSASSIAAGTPDTLTVAGTTVSPAQVYQGQTGVAMEKLTLTAAPKTVFLTGITLTENGTSTVDTDVSSVKIYKDDGDGNFSSATDTAVGSGTFAAQSATIAINDGGTGFLRIDSTASKVLFVVYDIAAAATLSQTLGVRIADETKLAVNAPDTVVPFAAITSTDSTIIAPPDTLTVAGTNIAPATGTVEQAQQNVGMLKLNLSTPTGSATLTSLKVDEGGTSTVDTDIQLAKLYQDANANGTFESASDTLLASGAFSSQSITFTPLNVAVAAGTPKDLFVVYDISPAATTGVNIDATVTAAGSVTLAFPDTVAGTFPAKSNQVTIGGNTVTVTGASLAPATVSMGQTNVAMEKLTFDVGWQSATLTQVKVDESGSSTTDTDIAAVKIYLDEGNGIFDGTESLQLSTTFTSQVANLGPINIPVSMGAPRTLFIVYDISASSSNGVDFKAKVADASYITVTAPDTVAAFTSALESTAASLPDTIAPAAIADLAAGAGTNHGEIVLTWTAPGDDGNKAGTKATKYTIKRDSAPITEATWAAATTIANTLTPQTQGLAETFTVLGLTECTTYYFAVKAEDEVANLAGISNSPNTQPKDKQAPSITHTPQKMASANSSLQQPIAIAATITDGCSVSSATLFYRKKGDTTFISAGMTASGSAYSASIPLSLITDNMSGIEYYIEAKDNTAGGGNVSDYPSTAPATPQKISTFKAYAFPAPWSLKSVFVSAADYGPAFSSPTSLITQDTQQEISLTPTDPADTTPPVGYNGKYTLNCAASTTLSWKIKNQTTPAETFDYPPFTAQCLNPSPMPQAVSSLDGKLLLTVPDNGVHEEVVVTVIPVDDVKIVATPAKQLSKIPSFVPRQPEKLLFVGGSYQVGPHLYALDKEAQLSLSYDDAQLEGLPEEKLGLYAWDDEKLAWEYAGGAIDKEGNHVTAPTSTLSTYRIILDNVPPEVKNFKPGDKDRYLTRTPEISAEISDLGSGVDPSSVSMYIDGGSVPVNLDAGKAKLIYIPDAPLAAGEHDITVVVKDKVGNETRLEKQKLLIPGDIKIERVFNAPNPVRSWGEIAFQYEVDEVNAKFFDVGGYSVSIEIYTITGKHIATLDGTGVATKQKIGKYIRFRRKADEGIEMPVLPNGVYIYRVIARDFEGKTISKVNKLVIAR